VNTKHLLFHTDVAFGPGLAPTSPLICVDIVVESHAHDFQLRVEEHLEIDRYRFPDFGVIAPKISFVSQCIESRHKNLLYVQCLSAGWKKGCGGGGQTTIPRAVFCKLGGGINLRWPSHSPGE